MLTYLFTNVSSLQHDGLIIFTEPFTWALKSCHWNTFPTPVRHDCDMRVISWSRITWFQILTPVISPMKLWKDWKDPPTESCSCPSTRAPPPRITWPVKPQSGKNMELCTITLSITIQVSFYLTEQRIKTHKHQGTFWTNFPFEFTKWIWEINDSSKSVIVVCQAFCLFLWLSG